jgi:hypothetical protein
VHACMNFANESACLTVNNVWNEVVTIHRSQEISFAINCFIKYTGTTILFALKARQTSTFTGWSGISWVKCGYFELYIPACETRLHQKRMSIVVRSHLWRQTVGTPASWIAPLQGVDCCCFLGSKLQQLCCPSCTTLWQSNFLNWMFQWFSRCMLKSVPYVI